MAAEVEVELDGGSQYPAHYKVMMDKLNEQRQLDQFTDITLIVDGHQFRAHKAVLAACSQFFHKFFQDFTQEPLVEIEGILRFTSILEKGAEKMKGD
uniref:Zinc finger protein 131 n=1 Tax=Scophthalmus maximus TaxID=52904 RepID=A0A8D2ZMR8_SCOMX